MAIIVKWTIEVARVPGGVQQQNVPGEQCLRLNNDFNANSGYVTVPGGDSPTSANITTAMNSVATNAAAAFNTATNLAVIQGWNSGTG